MPIDVIDCPQQDNGYDCGMYVLAFTELIAQHLADSLHSGHGHASINFASITPAFVSDMRKRVKQTFEACIAAYNERKASS